MTNAQFTQYVDGDPYVSVDSRFGYQTEPTQPPGWGAGGGVSVAPSGDTSGAEDLGAIQNAIDLATDAWTASAPHFTNADFVTVFLNGKYYISAPIVMKDGVRLVGQGWLGTSIHLVAGANSRMLMTPADAWWFSVEDIQFDGHSEAQTGGDAAIYITNGAPGMPAGSCRWPIIKNCYVQYAFGIGFKFLSVELRAIGCYAYRCGTGFEISGSDMFIESCTAGEAKTVGFLVTGSAHHITNCKAWWPGYVQTNRALLASKSGAPEDNLNYCCWDIRGGENMLSNCDGQDARGATFVIRGNNNQLRVQADASDGPCCTIIGGKYNIIDLNIGGGSSHGTQTSYVLSLWGNGEVGNIFRSNWTPNQNAGPVPVIAAALNSNTATARANDITIGTPKALVATTYAATVTPDPVLGGPAVTLTGGITIANPAADRFIPGTEFVIELTQDATGTRTVAWGTAYTGMTAADTAANKVNRWTVQCTGVAGKWVQKHFISY